MHRKRAGRGGQLVLIALVAIGALAWYSMRDQDNWLARLWKGNQQGASHASRIVHADDATFEQMVLRSDVPVLVDFYAEWCGPCRALAPLLEEVANETTGAKIVKLNIDTSPGVASRYGVNSIPTLILFKDGAPATQTVGLLDRQQLRSLLGQPSP